MKYILIAILGMALGASFFAFRPSLVQQPLSGIHAQFTADNVTNSSTSLALATGGAIVITAAQNAGIWFRISNLSTSSVYCAPANTTSAIGSLPSGVLLASPVSSTAVSFWNVEGVAGPIACVPTATAVITFSFVDKTKL